MGSKYFVVSCASLGENVCVVAYNISTAKEYIGRISEIHP